MEQNKETKEFYAFISYKREDERWARWLQHRLEHYRLPANLNGRTDLPKEIRPIFRDTSELLPGNLPQQINDALAASHHLIVICSPHSAQSVWVNKEIETFIALGKQANIIPFIVDGHPFAQNPDEECFPVAIRNLPSEQELLGANVAEMGREAAAVKTVARMFGIRFDTLWGRYQREQKRRRNWIIAAVAAAFLFLLGIGAYIWKQNDDFRHAISRAAAKEALQLIEQGDGYTAQRVALAALDKAYTPEAEYALRQAMQCNTAVLRGYSDRVENVVFSTDGKQILSSSSDGTSRIWDVSTGECLKKVDNWDEADGWLLEYSSDWKYRLSQENDSIHLRDVATGKCIWIKKASYATFTLDGLSVVTIAKDSNVCTWEVSTGNCLKTIKLSVVISKGYISPNGRYLIGSGGDDTVYVLDMATGNILHTITLFDYGEWFGVTFSPDSRHMLLSSWSGNVHKFDIATGKCLQVQEKLGRSSSYSPDGKYVAVGGDETVYLTDATSGRVIRTFNGHSNIVRSVAFSPDGKNIVSASDDKTLRIWNLDSTVFSPRIELDIDSFDFYDIYYHSPDSKYFALNVKDTIHIYNTTTGERLPLIITKVNCLAFSHDNRNIATASGDTILTYDLSIGKCLKSFVGHTDGIRSIAYSPDDKHIVSGSNDNTLRFWDASTGQCLRVMQGHNDEVESVDYSPDGLRIASASLEGTVRIWDASTGQCLQIIDKLRINASRVVFDPDGKSLLVCLYNMSLPIFDATTGKHIRTIEGHTSYILFVAFSPDGRYIVTYSEDKVIRIWDVHTGQCIQKASEKGSWLLDPVFTPDGRQIHFLRVEIDDTEITKQTFCTWDFLPLEELKAQVRARFKDNPLTTEERRQYYLE